MWIVIALLGWIVLTLPVSMWPGGSLELLLGVYLKAVIVFWLLGSVVTTAPRLRQLVIVLTLATVPLALTGLKHFADGSFLGSASGVARITGYQAGLAENPNDLALILNLLIPLGIALALTTRRMIIRVLLLGIVTLDAAAVIVTFSRAGFVALAVLMILYVGKLIRRPGVERTVAYSTIAIALGLLPFVPSGYADRIATITDVDADSTGSSQARWRDIAAASEYVAAHPIVGAGLGMDILALNETRGARWTQVHNVYLQYAVDLGLPGLLLFLALFARCVAAASATRRSISDIPALQDLARLAEGVEISLVVFAVAGLFYPVAYHFYFYYVAGLAMAAHAALDRGLQARGAVHA
jgi:O-antigen ligase